MSKDTANPNADTIESNLIRLSQLLETRQIFEGHPAQLQIPEWTGADVKVTADFTWEPQDFIEAHNLLVRTRHAHALTWLFFEIRDAFGGWLDASNKYGFYGSLAQAAQRHLARHQPEPDEPGPLLTAVVSVAFDWLNVLRDEGLIPPNAEIVYHSQDAEGQQQRIGQKDGRDTL